MAKLEERLERAATWVEAEAIFKDEDILLDRQALQNLKEILEKGIDETDELIDQIPYSVLVILNDKVHIRIKLCKWITLSKELIAKLVTLA